MLMEATNDLGHHLTVLVFQFYPDNPSTPIRDQERTSPHNIHTISIRQVMRIKRNINWGIISVSNNNTQGLPLQPTWPPR